MATSQPWSESWRELRAREPSQRLFALVDPAQEPSLLDLIVSDGLQQACLFGYDIDSPIARGTPRLVDLRDGAPCRLLSGLLRSMPMRPCATLLSSRFDLPALLQHFKQVVDVELEGIDSMFLAFWDPAILGALLGQPDDLTLHVSGPVLTAQQINALTAPIDRWWYWDRGGGMHAAALRSNQSDDVELPERAQLPLVLNERQVDMLVEASVPDHLIQHIGANQPELLAKILPTQRYDFVRQQLARARAHGLSGMGDLVNYVCVALAFGSRFDEVPTMAGPLAQVKASEITFAEALARAAEAELVEAGAAPELL